MEKWGVPFLFHLAQHLCWLLSVQVRVRGRVTCHWQSQVRVLPAELSRARGRLRFSEQEECRSLACKVSPSPMAGPAPPNPGASQLGQLACWAWKPLAGRNLSSGPFYTQFQLHAAHTTDVEKMLVSKWMRKCGGALNTVKTAQEKIVLHQGVSFSLLWYVDPYG